MFPVLDTFRIDNNEDTGLQTVTRLAIPYGMIYGPIEDVSEQYPNQYHVTSFIDEFGEKYHVLEPFAKVLDNWLIALEKEAHRAITFSTH